MKADHARLCIAFCFDTADRGGRAQSADDQERLSIARALAERDPPLGRDTEGDRAGRLPPQSQSALRGTGPVQRRAYSSIEKWTAGRGGGKVVVDAEAGL